MFERAQHELIRKATFFGHKPPPMILVLLHTKSPEGVSQGLQDPVGDHYIPSLPEPRGALPVLPLLPSSVTIWTFIETIGHKMPNV